TAFKAFFRALRDREFSGHVDKLLQTKTALPPARESMAVELLAAMQREGRLVDFLNEEIEGFPDAQVGAVVRSLHKGCRQVLQQYMKLEPIIASDEGEKVNVEPGFDPAAVRLVGKVQGDPPFEGTLRHHGWRVTQVKLPELKNKEVVLPAEVEL
ncbi:unnamed protein product, partial [Phaeothamnion confervicola]